MLCRVSGLSPSRALSALNPLQSRTTVAATLVLVSILATQPAGALVLDQAALDRLKAGEPVTAFAPDATETAAGTLEAVIDIPTGPDKIWTILTSCDLNLKVFNGLKGCKVIRTDPDALGDVREHAISWSRLLPTVRSVFASRYDKPRSIAFERVEGDLKRLKGEWRLEPWPDGAGTRLHYKALVAVGIPVPSSLMRSALEGDMPKTMKAIRKAAIDGAGG